MSDQSNEQSSSFNSLFQNNETSLNNGSNQRTTPPTNNLPFLLNQNQNNQFSLNQNNMNDLNLPLPLATQWIANMNNNLMNMNPLNSNTVNNNRPFVGMNQPLSNLLPAFVSTTQAIPGKVTGQAAPLPGVFTFPSVEMMGLNQQYQSSHLNNLQFQTQFLDSLKTNSVSQFQS